MSDVSLNYYFCVLCRVWSRLFFVYFPPLGGKKKFCSNKRQCAKRIEPTEDKKRGIWNHEFVYPYPYTYITSKHVYTDWNSNNNNWVSSVFLCWCLCVDARILNQMTYIYIKENLLYRIYLIYVLWFFHIRNTHTHTVFAYATRCLIKSATKWMSQTHIKKYGTHAQ